MLDAERLLKAGYLALCHGDTKTSLTEKGLRPRRRRLVEHIFIFDHIKSNSTTSDMSKHCFIYLLQGAQDVESQGIGWNRKTGWDGLASHHKTSVEKVG